MQNRQKSRVLYKNRKEKTLGEKQRNDFSESYGTFGGEEGSDILK